MMGRKAAMLLALSLRHVRGILVAHREKDSTRQSWE